jgi:uncharacterized protein (DUF1810 family)
MEQNLSVAYDLDRFLLAQHQVYDGALEELRRGRKAGHWIWFIFPQVTGLGYSAMSQTYAIRSLDEARAYLAHPILGARVRQGRPRNHGPDGGEDLRLDRRDELRSCLTLFHRAAPDEPVFAPGA